MKCSECTRRNNDANTFCIYCGTALTEPAHPAATNPQKKLKAMLPPQDISELIGDRYQGVLLRNESRSVHPAVAVSLAVLLGLSGVYYWYFYRDTVEIMAIDYANSEVINGQ